jgi:uncharacterized protein involved in outer membrane biogenesis
MSGETGMGARASRGGVLFKLLILLVVIFAFAALAWMLFLPGIVTSQFRRQSGFDATVERLVFNPLTGSVEIRGFVVTNPPTFPISDFLHLQEFRATAKVRTLFSDQPEFDQMFINVSKLTLVKRDDGTTNAQALQNNIKGTQKQALVAKPSSKPSFLIRRLELKIDRLVIVDHSVRQPTTREFTLNLDQRYADVTSLEELFAPGVLKNLAPVAAAIGALIPGDLGRVLTEAGSSSTELLKQAGRKAGAKVKGFFDALEESKKP